MAHVSGRHFFPEAEADEARQRRDVGGGVAHGGRVEEGGVHRLRTWVDMSVSHWHACPTGHNSQYIAAHVRHGHDLQAITKRPMLTSCSNWDRSLASTYGKNCTDFTLEWTVSKFAKW